MLEIGTLVHHSGHGNGEIIDYNGNVENTYAVNHINDIPDEIVVAVLPSFYPAERYPYIVLFENGYQDVYSDGELEVGHV